MEKQKVSIWIGSFENEKILEQYFDATYSKDGDRLRSIFEKKFCIERINDDFVEKSFFEKGAPIDVMFKWKSYSDQIIPRISIYNETIMACRGNASIFVYDFEYNGDIISDEGDGYNIKYIGSAEYEI